MKVLQYTKMRARFSASCSRDSHLLAVAWITSYGSIDAPMIDGDNAFYESKVAFLYLVLFHLLDQCSLGARVFCHNNQPTGILIEAVNNTWM